MYVVTIQTTKFAPFFSVNKLSLSHGVHSAGKYLSLNHLLLRFISTLLKLEISTLLKTITNSCFQALEGLKFQALEGLKFQNKQTQKQMIQAFVHIRVFYISF